MENLTYVHKFLADAGCGSRRNMIEAMKSGRVKVNGKTTQDPRFLIDPQKDTVMLGKQIVKARDPKIYLMLNKPLGTITTNSDPQGRPTVFSLVPEQFKKYRLFAVGRLDVDTEGLLILTNDGELTNQLTHPKYEHEKEYAVTIAAELTDKQIREVKRGMILEDGRTAPAKISQAHASQHVTYHLTIYEGRKRQIRRMFERLGFRVLNLKRLRIGQLRLDKKLKPGQMRPLTATEVKDLAAKPKSKPHN
jgi:23S rRNA pseudouridine2605 synthase